MANKFGDEEIPVSSSGDVNQFGDSPIESKTVTTVSEPQKESEDDSYYGLLDSLTKDRSLGGYAKRAITIPFAPVEAAVTGIGGMLEGMGRATYGAGKAAVEGRNIAEGAKQGLADVKIRAQSNAGKIFEKAFGDLIEGTKDYLGGPGQIDHPPGWNIRTQGPYDPINDPDKERARKWLERQNIRQTVTGATIDTEMARAMTTTPLSAIKERRIEREAQQAAKERYAREQEITRNQWDTLIEEQEAIARERPYQDTNAHVRDIQESQGLFPEDQNMTLRGGQMGGILDEQTRLRAEAELNPQGELENPYPIRSREQATEDAIKNRYVMTEPETGARDVNKTEFERLVPERMDQDMVLRHTENVDYLPGNEKEGVRPTEIETLKPVGEDLADIPYKPHISAPEVARQIRLGKRQGGVIDPDLLTLGTGKYFEALRDKFPDIKEAAVELMKKFIGTFKEDALADVSRSRFNPNSRETVVLMSPDDFHRAAYPREGGLYAGTNSAKRNAASERRRTSIREGLETKEGLDALPELIIAGNRVFGHNGRHRMDVFKEQGLDLVPVRIRTDNIRWGTEDKRPAQIRSEDGKNYVPMPDSIFYPKGQEVSTTPRKPYVPLSQRGAIGDWDKRLPKSIGKKGIALTAAEELKKITPETRDLDTLIKEEGITTENIKDLPDTILQKVSNRTLIDKTISILSQDKGPIGKIVKWAVDRRSAIDQAKEIRIRDTIEDAIGHWIKLGKAGRGDLREMLDVWTKNIGKSELTESHFKNTKQYEMFARTRDALNRTIEEVNDKRREQGKQPIPKLTNYLPAIWQGDYRVWIKDKSGNNVGVYAFKNEIQAKFAKKFLQKEHPDLMVEDPSHIKKTVDYHDFSAFEEAMIVNGKDWGATKALQKTYVRLLKQKGFGPHGLHRQDLFGYLGFEHGDLGVKNMQKAIELYVKRAANHIANIDKANLQIQFNKLDPSFLEKIPVAAKYLNDYISNSRGVDLSGLQGIDKLFESLGESSGFGRSAPQRLLNNLSGLGSLYFLVTPKFIASQFLQPFNMLAKLRQMNIRLPDSHNFATSFLRGYQRLLFPDQIAKDAAKWAEKNEYLDSTIISLLSMHKSDIATSGTSKIANIARLGLGKVEKGAVRLPAFLAFEESLRGVTKDPETRFRQAAELMDYYMVHYDRSSSPLIYNDLGLVGEAARPLKQYSHNAFGQFFEYLQGAKNHNEFSPLFGYLATQALVAGARGMIGVAEATAVITLINTVFGTDWDTPEQILTKSGMSDWMLFGVPSANLGIDLSSSVSAPALPEMFTAMPVSFGAKAIKDMATWLYHYVNGEVTDADSLKVLQSITPSTMRGFWEELFTQEGGPVPKPGQEMKGNYVRDETEKKIATYLNLHSLDESRADAMASTIKQITARENALKLDQIDIMASRIMNGEEISDKQIEQFLKMGGNINTLKNTLKQRAIGRSLPWQDLQFIGKITPGKARTLELMKDELDRQSEIGLPKESDVVENPYIQKQAYISGNPHGQPDEFADWLESKSPKERIEIMRALRKKGIMIPPNVDPNFNKNGVGTRIIHST